MPSSSGKTIHEGREREGNGREGKGRLLTLKGSKQSKEKSKDSMTITNVRLARSKLVNSLINVVINL